MRQPSWPGSVEAADAGPAPSVTGFQDGSDIRLEALAADPVAELLLLRAVDDPDRADVARRLLDERSGSPLWPATGDADLWELYDPSDASDDEPVAVAATRASGSGRVSLVAVVVASRLRGRGLGHRLVEELADALRARGALVLAAAVPGGPAATAAVLERAGFRPSTTGGDAVTVHPDLVWFDLEL
jgi:GNAT superfamily N-acetyltransferase